MMRVETLRAFDRWIGIPACVLLTLHRRVRRRPTTDRPLRRIVFVKLAEQGSTVLAADALARTCDRVGPENVFVVVFEENRFILDALGLVPAENVIPLRARTLSSAARSLVSVIRRLRRLQIDAAVDLEFFARGSAILAYLSGADSRAGLHSHAGEGPYRGDLFTHRPLFSPYLHTSQLFLLLVDALDQPAGRFPAYPALPPALDSPTRLHQPQREDLDAVWGLLQERTHRNDTPPIILLNANCGDLLPQRRWDGHRYVELARRLLAEMPEIVVVLTGSADEAAGVEALAARVSSERCVSLAGRTTMGQLLALYCVSEVLVTNDSGPSHFASLTPVDVVTLFGPETPALFAARTPRNHVLWSGLACSPCITAFNNRRSTCRDNLCMQAITVDEVFETVVRAYRSRAEASNQRPPSF